MGVRSTNTTQSFGSDFYRSGIEAADPYVPPPIPYVDDVFSIYLHTGNSSDNTTGPNQTINNGIDLANEGGLVWTKDRTSIRNHHLFSSNFSIINTFLRTDSTGIATNTSFTHMQSFNNDGFTIGPSASTNYNTNDYVSWTFRKEPGFFDIVTYSGSGGAQSIPHNLGSTPGMIIVKALNDVQNWSIFHTSLGGTKSLIFTHTDVQTSNIYWNDTNPTSTHFTVGSSYSATGKNYVAYLFAHNHQRFGENGNEAIIKCGSYTGDGNAGNSFGNHQDLGFEPQFLMIKNTSRDSDPYTSWYIFDNMRGVAYGTGTNFPGGNDNYLLANKNNNETDDAIVNFTSTGFSLTNSGFNLNTLDDNYIYMAIRRPNKPKTVGTDVFMPYSVSSGEGQDTLINVGFDVDFFLYRKTGDANSPGGVIGDRMRGKSGGGDLLTSNSEGEDTNSGAFFLDQSRSVTVDYSGGHTNAAPAATNDSYVRYFFKRAPEFFDIVAYKGNAVSGRQIPHNLQAEPEMIWVKNRNPSSNSNTGWDWRVYVKDLGNTGYLRLNSHDGEITDNQNWNSTTPTSTHFTIGNGVYTNENDSEFIAYLFGSLPGVSKIGTYSNGSTSAVQNIDCGFNSPARFVMIKRYDSGITSAAQGQWAVWDSARGIGTGNDGYVSLNTNGVEVTGFDDISTFSSGFTVNVESANTSGYFNVSNASYIYLAIA